jgi:hypothetical protein
VTDVTNFQRMHKSGGLFPKIAPLPGSLHAEWRRCGKPTCRCTRGELHGPYWVRRWWEHGKQRKVYVPRHRLAAVAAGIARWQQLHPPIWAMRQMLAELKRLEQGC